METRSVNFPCRLELYGHGDLVAHNSQELAAYEGMGWVPKPDTPPSYELFPMYLRGEDLPDLLVANEAEAKAASRRGYRLPSDDVIEGGKDAFAQAYEVEDEDYEPAEYPKYLAHPDFVAETLGRWTYDRGPVGLAEGRFIPGKPAKFASVRRANSQRRPIPVALRPCNTASIPTAAQPIYRAILTRLRA
jgi:hypothetical protein